MKCAVFLLIASVSSAAEVTVTVKPAKTQVTVGEAFALELTAEGPAGTEYVFPGDVQEETFEMHPQPEARPQPGQQTYRASVFALKDAAIPPLGISYTLPDGTRGQVRTEPVPLEIQSALPRDPKEQQLADIRPPVPLAIGRAFLIALVVLVAVLGGLAYWLWRRRRPAAAPAPVRPPVPPDVAANTALERLAASGLLAAENYRAFYIQLTEIAKRYLEARLDAPILEMTTAEMVAFLRATWSGSELADLMRDVSGAADQIKFARGQGARALAEGHLDAVRRMIAAVEARRRPAEPTPPAARRPGENRSR
jgi:hypothetical protein